MDGQHQYEIKLKKDDLFINLSSDDVYFISKQMDKWFKILLDDSYVPVAPPLKPQPIPVPAFSSQPIPPQATPEMGNVAPQQVQQQPYPQQSYPGQPVYPEMPANPHEAVHQQAAAMPVMEAPQAYAPVMSPVAMHSTPLPEVVPVQMGYAPSPMPQAMPVAQDSAPVMQQQAMYPPPPAMAGATASLPQALQQAVMPVMQQPQAMQQQAFQQPMPQPAQDQMQPANNPAPANAYQAMSEVAPMQQMPAVNPPLADVQLPMAAAVQAPVYVAPAYANEAMQQQPVPALMATQPQMAQSTAPSHNAALDLPSLAAFKTLPAGQDDFEAVMDSVMKDLEDDDDPIERRLQEIAMQENSRNEDATPQAGQAGSSRPPLPPLRNDSGFLDDEYDEPMSASTDLSSIASLSDLCDRSRAENVDEFLLLASYYLTHYEHQSTFSLKRLNSVLVKSGLTPVNHSILETALSQGYLAMVPDLTGTADVSEYQLTPDGQHTAVQLI